MTNIGGINMPWFVGYPREKINWGPTIDDKKCVGCGLCLNCGKKVFGWRDGKAIVENYEECVVGCSTCGNLCAGKAISFPSLELIRDIYKKEGIWAKVKQKMVEDGQIPE